MSIKTGKYGKVSWDPLGGTALVPIISIKAWKGDFATDYEDVTCFGDANKVYLPGNLDVQGSFDGHWNSAELALFKAAMSAVPGTLQLMPNTTESAFFWQGSAYMDASIDCSLNAPKITGNFRAAGSWTAPGQVLATGAGPGTGLGTFTPAGATPPQNFAALTGVVANPATAWTSGQYIQLGDGSRANWSGTAWAVGAHA
jgi:hypothetical protein